MKNSKLIGLKELQKLQLQILIDFDKICKKNNLKYFLAGGTLLGAVRHKGFIPWDDDIDVAMPRTDYNKLIKLSKELPEKYQLICPEKVKQYKILFSKIVYKKYFEVEKGLKDNYGIFIDIFPLDGLGNNKHKARIHAKKILIMRTIINICFLDNNLFSKLLKKIHFNNLTYRILMRTFNKYNYHESKYVGSIAGGLRMLDEIFEYRVYSETMDMEFEGKIFKGMKYYDEYLTRMYGDYMKLPPKEKQVAEHNVEIYDMRGE